MAMKKSDQLLNQVSEKLATYLTGSLIDPGQTVYNKQVESPYALVDAINNLFAQFEVAFPNLYHRAYATDESIRLAKQLWLNSLRRFSPAVILRAAQKAIETSDFIPTINKVLRFCEDQRAVYGLPDVRAAYIEACRATSPKAEFSWSHPAVYYAGVATDWFFLSNNAEIDALPVFERNYAILCERVMAGEQLDIPVPVAIPAEIPVRLSAKERKEKLKTLRQELGI